MLNINILQVQAELKYQTPGGGGDMTEKAFGEKCEKREKKKKEQKEQKEQKEKRRTKLKK
jgi:hypothetical protein